MTSLPVQSRTSFIMRWIGGTFVGCMLALFVVVLWAGLSIVVSEIIPQYFRGDAQTHSWIGNAFFWLLTVVALLVMGGTIGFAQWQLALRGRVPRRVWILTGAIAACTDVVGFLAGSLLAPSEFFGLVDVRPGMMSGTDDRYLVSPTWLIGVLVLGIPIGIASGIPQWLVLRHYFHRAEVYLLAVVLSGVGIVTSLIAIVYLVGNAVLTEGLSCCMSPIVFGAITGSVLYSLLRRPKRSDSELQAITPL